jgi:hypothetical protein
MLCVVVSSGCAMTKKIYGMNVCNLQVHNVEWPGLYWPLTDPSQRQFIYSLSDIWRFTVLWCCLLAIPVYVMVGAWAVLMFDKKSTFMGYYVLVVVLVALAASAAFIGGSIVGISLGLIYRFGCFSMSTYVPLLWGVIQVLILVVGSYSSIISIL